MKDEKREQGLRYNEGKPMVDLIPPNVIIELAKHYTYGANKYHPHNWLDGFPYSQCYASLQRHLLAWYGGERNDPESGHHHLIAVIWNAVTLLYFELLPAKYKKFDDRPWAQPPEIIVRVDAGQAHDELKDFGYALGTPLRKPTAKWMEQVMGELEPQEPGSVPIPEGMILLGPYAHIKENDLVWNPDKDEAQWTEASQLGRAWSGLYGYDPIKPVTRRVARNYQYCPLCTTGATALYDNHNVPHESNCPFKEMKWKYILKSDDSIASWHRVFDRGAFRDPLPSELDCQVGGRAIVCDRTKDGKLCT